MADKFVPRNGAVEAVSCSARSAAKPKRGTAYIHLESWAKLQCISDPHDPSGACVPCKRRGLELHCGPRTWPDKVTKRVQPYDASNSPSNTPSAEKSKIALLETSVEELKSSLSNIEKLLLSPIFEVFLITEKIWLQPKQNTSFRSTHQGLSLILPRSTSHKGRGFSTTLVVLEWTRFRLPQISTFTFNPRLHPLATS